MSHLSAVDLVVVRVGLVEALDCPEEVPQVGGIGTEASRLRGEHVMSDAKEDVVVARVSGLQVGEEGEKTTTHHHMEMAVRRALPPAQHPPQRATRVMRSAWK